MDKEKKDAGSRDKLGAGWKELYSLLKEKSGYVVLPRTGEGKFRFPPVMDEVAHKNILVSIKHEEVEKYYKKIPSERLLAYSGEVFVVCAEDSIKSLEPTRNYTIIVSELLVENVISHLKTKCSSDQQIDYFVSSPF